MGLSSARGRPCRATSPAPARAQDWFLSNNKRNTNKKPKHEFKWDCLSQVGVPLQKPAWPSRWQACPWGHGSVPGPCEELHGRGGAPPSPLSPKCFAWERACSQSDANLLWLQPWGSAGRWWPPCPAQPRGQSPSPGGRWHPPCHLHQPETGIPTPGPPRHPSPSAAPRQRRLIPTNQFDSAQQEQLQFKNHASL